MTAMAPAKFEPGVVVHDVLVEQRVELVCPLRIALSNF
jgi:hypothetical protein